MVLCACDRHLVRPITFHVSLKGARSDKLTCKNQSNATIAPSGASRVLKSHRSNWLRCVHLKSDQQILGLIINPLPLGNNKQPPPPKLCRIVVISSYGARVCVESSRRPASDPPADGGAGRVFGGRASGNEQKVTFSKLESLDSAR